MGLPHLFHTFRASVRYGFIIRYATPHTTEATLKKHIFSEPSRVPSIPDNAKKITPGIYLFPQIPTYNQPFDARRN